MADHAPSRDLVVRPQRGPQELFLSIPADIGIIGGGVYGGKTWALAIEPLRHVEVPGFTFVAFRREMPDATNPGGIWDETKKWYPAAGGQIREHVHEWEFPSGAKGKIAGLQYEHTVEDWKSSQVCVFLFDQLETFTERQFFYMLSRNRSTCGVEPYIRASCNPDPDSFLATLLAWWIDDAGWAMPERSGVIRWFIRVDDTIVWSDVQCAPDEYAGYAGKRAAAIANLAVQHPAEAPYALSFAFVLARLQDNAIGTQLDPTYEGKVRAMSRVDRERLLGGDRGGNWKIRATAGLVFDRAWFDVLDIAPASTGAVVRYWDKAGTQGGGKYSAGVRMFEAGRQFYVDDVVRGQWSARHREDAIRQTALLDYAKYGDRLQIWIEQEPGSGGKESAESSVLNLPGFDVHIERVTGDKLTRAKPLSAQAEAKNVKLVRGGWDVEAFLHELHQFDGASGFTDQVDGASGAFNKLTLGKPTDVVAPITRPDRRWQDSYFRR